MKWLKRLWMLWKFDTARIMLFDAWMYQHCQDREAAALLFSLVEDMEKERESL